MGGNGLQGGVGYIRGFGVEGKAVDELSYLSWRRFVDFTAKVCQNMTSHISTGEDL